MPKLSDTMTEGTVVSWKKAEGDTIEMGDIIAEIETDKATMEMEAFDDGVMAKILVGEGGKAPVGSLLAIMAEEDESVEDAIASAGDSGSAAPATADAAAPAAAAAAPTAGAAPAPTVAEDGSRLKASPLAKKIAAEQGVNLATVVGSGAGGRIVKEDVLKAAANPAPAPAAAPAASAAPAVQAINPVAGAEDEKIPLTSMRKIIADRLLTSKVTIPHFYLHVECDAAPLMSLRKQINSQTESTHGNKYTVNDFIMKAVINACVAVPDVNASYAGDHVVKFANVGVSVAIAVEDGLVTPVVKAAQTKSLLEISKEVKGMAGRARDKKLKPDEFDGGTITCLLYTSDAADD